MAVGDLVTADFIFEFNGLAIGKDTDYDIREVTGLMGFTSRSRTNERFGRHGGVSQRHFADLKKVIINGNILATSDTDAQTKRRALGAAAAIIVNPDDTTPLVTQFPGTGTRKMVVNARPKRLKMPVNRAHALQWMPYTLEFEVADPIIRELTTQISSFTPPSDTNSLNNTGNAPAHWEATIIGPADAPIITNNDTGQTLSLPTLNLVSTDTLTFDSATSEIKLNGILIGVGLDTGFSWWDLEPGNNSITMAATNSSSAVFSMTWMNSFWIV